MIGGRLTRPGRTLHVVGGRDHRPEPSNGTSPARTWSREGAAVALRPVCEAHPSRFTAEAEGSAKLEAAITRFADARLGRPAELSNGSAR